MVKKSWLSALGYFGCALAFFFVGTAVADTGSATSLSGVAQNVTDTFGAVAKLVTAGAYVAGMGFAVGAVMKFKAHKDNPQQIPIGTPIALIFIAAALIFLPSIFGVAGGTLFGGSAQQGTVQGVQSFDLGS